MNEANVASRLEDSNDRVRCTITAEFLTDAHLGSGSGGGGIDGLVSRDRYDRPVIWATHLEGVLRDAARRRFGVQHAEALFGCAGGQQQQALFTSLYAPNRAETRVWRSTARAAFDNRAPKEDTLRVYEYVPKGMRFRGEVELPSSHFEQLRALMQEVDSLGGGRASGAGRVKLSISKAPLPTKDTGAATGRLRILFRNRDPVCITSTATPGNLIPSLAFIPGRTLLGALANSIISAGDRTIASLLVDGTVSVSDALPLPDAVESLDALEVLPAPLSLQSEKPIGSNGQVPWWAQSVAVPERHDAWESQKTKLKRPEDDLHLYRDSVHSSWSAYRPKRRIRLRNGRPDPQQADPQLFAVEQIVEDTHFVAELEGPVDAMRKITQGLSPVLQGHRWLRVGRGGAPLEVARFQWLESHTPVSAQPRMKLVLTSDLLVRDELLRWRTALDSAALSELIGASVELHRDIQEGTAVHGFNGTSRLWRMPSAAVRRGAVYELSGPGLAVLAARASAGQWLGERTHEGFGRFRLDALLPGAGVVGRSGVVPDTSDAADEAAAAETKRWMSECSGLMTQDGTRKPSLSQWYELVTELALEAQSRRDAAIPARMNPTTAGGRNWSHEAARRVLRNLQALDAATRALYARQFVRWYRAKLRKTDKGNAP